MNNSKIIELLKCESTFEIAMITLYNDKVIKRQFVEHLSFIVLKHIFKRKPLQIKHVIDLLTICNDYVTYCGDYFKICLETKTLEFRRNRRYSLCNPEDCVEVMKKLDNITYSYIDWWYKYYVTKEIK